MAYLHYWDSNDYSTNPNMLLDNVFNSTSLTRPVCGDSAVPRNDTFVASQEVYLDKIITQVNLYVPPFLIVIGNIFNILSILVMRHKYFRNMSTSVYMVAGAVNDATSLLISLISHWVSVNFPYAISRNPAMNVMCAFFNFYGWGNCDFSIIVTAAMTADRAYAIKYPIQNSSANSIKRARVVICILTIVVVVKEFHLLFYSIIVPADRKDRMCDVDLTNPQYCLFYNDVWPWVHLSLLSICFIVIILSNSIIILSVKNAGGKTLKKSIATKNNNSDIQTRRNTRAKAKWRQIAVMLVADSLALLLLTFPFSVHLAVTLTMSGASEQQKRINGYVFAIVLYLLYSNKCVNFCLYCMTGSRFRAALREVTRRKPFRCQNGSLVNALAKNGVHESVCSFNNISTSNSITPAGSLKKKEDYTIDTHKL